MFLCLAVDFQKHYLLFVFIVSTLQQMSTKNRSLCKKSFRKAVDFLDSFS